MASRLVCCLYFAANHKLLVASAAIFAVARHGRRSWERYRPALWIETTTLPVGTPRRASAFRKRAAERVYTVNKRR